MTLSPQRPQGFTLVELTIVLVIVALLIGGLMLSLSASRDVANERETQKHLSEFKEALLGFAAANGRFPCPASDTSNGVESFCTNDIPANCGTIILPPTAPPAHGRCSNPFDGLLPGATLGLSNLDTNGYPIDAWGSAANRYRYAVTDKAIGTLNHPFTVSDGIKTVTMASISATTPLLSVCNASTGITNSGTANASCTTTTTLTTNAVAVIFSQGRNAPTGGTGNDEAANLDGDSAFVSHAPEGASAPGGEFDDIVVWISQNILFNRMISANRLP